MGYSKDVYDAALSELEMRRSTSEKTNASIREEFFKKFPRVLEIEQLLARTSVMAARAVLMKKSDLRTELTKLKEYNLKLQKEQHDILVKNGYSADYLNIHYQCPECKDTGYIDGKMCTCLKSLLREKAYDKLNSSSPLSLSDFGSFSLQYYSKAVDEIKKVSPYSRMEKILNFCKGYAANFSKNSESLLFQGGPGLGKTHLSLAIARAVIARGCGVIYVSAPDILSTLEKERFAGRGESRSDETEKLLKDCDLLILDDLGTEFTTQFTTSTIYNIINTRMMLSKPTIISTNLSLSQLQKLYSMRMVSRIIGGVTRLEFLGTDIRQKKYNNTIKKGD